VEKIGKSYYVHAKHIIGAVLADGKIIEDVNAKTYGRQKMTATCSINLACGKIVKAMVIQVRESSKPDTLWLTDTENDDHILCPDAVEKVGTLLNLSTLTGEPLGCGSYKRWAGHAAVEPRFMTGLLIARGL
jgi:hypothetical protein